MQRVKGQFKIRSVYQGLTVGKLLSPKLAKLLPEILKYALDYICVSTKQATKINVKLHK